MQFRWLLATLLAAASALTQAAPSRTVTDGALNVPVNARIRLTFECQQSTTGACHNTLVGESGWVAERFSVPVGQKRVLYDVSESLRLCMTDAPIHDASQCNAQPLRALLAPLVRN